MRLRSTELPDGRPNSEFRKMETPGLRPGSTTNRQRRSRPQPCKHCAALVRRKRIPASSKRRKMHLVGARVKEIALMREHAISPSGEWSKTNMAAVRRAELHFAAPVKPLHDAGQRATTRWPHRSQSLCPL